jgi:hypothetical protein
VAETEDPPSWLTREALVALPEALVLREVRYRVGTPGFRTREITLVTRRLDAEAYRVSDLAELYRWRWQVETSLAQLKTGMQMDVLHCKTVRPHRVEPRVKKRRPKSFPLMLTPRQELRQRLVQPEIRG